MDMLIDLFSFSLFIFWIKHLKVHDAYCMGFFPNGEDPSTLLGGKVSYFPIIFKIFW